MEAFVRLVNVYQLDHITSVHDHVSAHKPDTRPSPAEPCVVAGRAVRCGGPSRALWRAEPCVVAGRQPANQPEGPSSDPMRGTYWSK